MPAVVVPEAAAERIARWALATQYGYEGRVHWKPPMVTKMAVEEGMLTLRAHGLLKLEEGLTSVEEVLKETSKDD